MKLEIQVSPQEVKALRHWYEKDSDLSVVMDATGIDLLTLISRLGSLIVETQQQVQEGVVMEKIEQSFLVGTRTQIWRLIHKQTRLPAHMGQKLTTEDSSYELLSGCPPSHSGSSGRVYVQGAGERREFFPHVFELVWVCEEVGQE